MSNWRKNGLLGKAATAKSITPDAPCTTTLLLERAIAV